MTGPSATARRAPGLPGDAQATVRAWTDRLAIATAAWGHPVEVDGAGLLAERAELRGLVPQGRTSHGGAARLLPCADGWAAISLARPTDVELVPAWCGLLELDRRSDDPWTAVTELAAGTSGTQLVEAATLLGLPVASLGERRPDGSNGITTTTFGASGERPDRPVRVLDLSALWAGPLAAALLGRAGAEVIKVEATDRPDGARRGDPNLHDRLNGHKRLVSLDLRTDRGRRELVGMVADADVVVTASRRRALRQLGLDPAAWLGAATGPKVWVAITGHGLGSDRVAFGDDAAVAGALVGADAQGPVFAGDALADPLSGLAAATAAAEALHSNRRVLIDVAMAGVAAEVASAAGAGR